MTGTFTRFAPADLGVTATPVPDEVVWLDIRPDVGRLRAGNHGLILSLLFICLVCVDRATR